MCIAVVMDMGLYAVRHIVLLCMIYFCNSKSLQSFSPTAYMSKRKDEFDGASLTKRQTVDSHLLPAAEREYFRSYAHDSVISCVACCKSVVVSGTKEGTISFWKEEKGNLAFVKQYVAHRDKAVIQVSFSDDGEKMASLGDGDTSIKVFDTTTFDMIQVLTCKMIPSHISWCSYEKSDRIIYAVGKDLHMVNPNGDELEEDDEEALPSIHRFPVASMEYNRKYGFSISVDRKGLIEYWIPGGTFPLPKVVKFQLKTETQLFELAKNKVSCSKLIYSDNWDQFATVSEDGIRVWDVLRGTIVAKFNDGIDVEGSVAFEPSGKYIICRSSDQKGGSIKVLDIKTGSTLWSYGELDCERYGYKFQDFCLLENMDISDFTIDMISSENTVLQSKLQKSPLLICGADNSNKLFIFGGVGDQKDKESSRDRSIQVNKANILKEKRKGILSQYSKVTLHTTLGDITVKLFRDQTPKTVENFLTLCERHYYDHVIFHRVIKKFMVQTGDPLGDGTGGESAWGGHFKDEFNPLLNHTKPYMLSMANAGPNTNGSQFFITTEPAPWLDGKHTVFGEVIDGKEVVKTIEAVETDKGDKPLDQIVILSTTQHGTE